MTPFELDQAVGHHYYEATHRAARGGTGSDDRPPSSAQPLRYDESGFPVPSRTTSLTERLMRLLGG